MKFSKYNVADAKGNSNCVVRSFCKIYNDSYDNVYKKLCSIARELIIDSFNDVKVFETYMIRNQTFLIDYGKNIKVKDLKLGKGNYIVFCWNKKEFYHMVAIIDDIMYDKNDNSLELFTISIYKKYS